MDAECKALELSKADRFGTVYTVLKKKGYDPIVVCNEMVKMQKMKERWKIVAAFKNGVQII